MTDLAELRSDVRAFASAVGFPMTTWKADALKLEQRTTAIVASRPSWKSLSLA